MGVADVPTTPGPILKSGLDQLEHIHLPTLEPDQRFVMIAAQRGDAIELGSAMRINDQWKVSAGLRQHLKKSPPEWQFKLVWEF